MRRPPFPRQESPPRPARPGRRRNSLPDHARLLPQPFRQVCAASRLGVRTGLRVDCRIHPRGAFARRCIAVTSSPLWPIWYHRVAGTLALIAGAFSQSFRVNARKPCPRPRDPRHPQLSQRPGRRQIRHGQFGRELFRWDSMRHFDRGRQRRAPVSGDIERLAPDLVEGIQIAQRHDRALRRQVQEGRGPVPLPRPPRDIGSQSWPAVSPTSLRPVSRRTTRIAISRLAGTVAPGDRDPRRSSRFRACPPARTLHPRLLGFEHLDGVHALPLLGCMRGIVWHHASREPLPCPANDPRTPAARSARSGATTPARTDAGAAEASASRRETAS